MRIAVIGAGNMGCVYGGNLARTGQEIVLVDPYEEHIEAIRTNGLQMEGLNGSYTAEVQATTDPADVSDADVAIICVNTYNTRDAARSAKTVLRDVGYALTLQNGMGNVEILADVLGNERVIPGLTFHSGDLTGPGKVTHTNEGPTYLGELDGARSDRLLELNDLMGRANLKPQIESDIMTTIWSKFVHNCGINAVCAITDLRPGDIQDVPEVDAFQTRILEEVLALAAAKGVVLPEEDPIDVVKEYCSTKFHRVSMVQHLKRGRLTEIDALNAYVARESGALGLTAPYNDSLAKLVKGLEHKQTD